jgi:hypothetical protein
MQLQYPTACANGGARRLAVRIILTYPRGKDVRVHVHVGRMTGWGSYGRPPWGWGHALAPAVAAAHPAGGQQHY